MKKIVFIFELVAFSEALANPITPQLLSELYFDSTGWKIEILHRDFYYRRIVVMSLTDSAAVDTSVHLSGDFSVISSSDMETTCHINPSGDHVRIGFLVHPTLVWVINDFIFGEGGVIAAPRQGESISYGGEGEASDLNYYLDSSPTLGAPNDFIGAIGRIHGKVINNDGNPVSNCIVSYSVLTRSDKEVTTTVSDEKGEIELECPAARQYFTLKHKNYRLVRVPIQIWPDSTVEYIFNISLLGVDRIPEPAHFPIHLMNYPNPFNLSTTIKYYLPTEDDVVLSVYDLSGRQVERLFTGRQKAGEYHYLWSGGRLPSGVYFISLDTGGQRVIQKCLLME